MGKKYDILFTPFQIGDVKIKNRIVETAVTGTSLIAKGEFHEPTRKFYLERAKGGVGLIISGAAMVKDIFGRDYDLDTCGDVFNGPIKSLMEEIHEYGAKFFLQIGVGLGRVVGLKPFSFLPGANLDAVRTSASRLPNVWDPSVIHEEMTKAEIERRVEIAVKAAEMAKAAEIDGVEVHAVHEGYLLDQFAIANTNERADEYGGSLENRLRFATDVIKGIKEACGAEYPVSVRYSVVSKMKGLNSAALPDEKYEEFGRDYEESIEVAKLLEAAGCDCLNADNGSYDSWYWAHPPVYMKKACNLDDCAFIKKHVDIPVICAGRMEDPDIASKAIDDKNVDGIGIARQLLADPQWPNKVKDGKIEDILPCIACHNGCLGRLLEGAGMSCALNPAAMQESKYKIIPAKSIKKVLVIGGGIGGMEAARICALRGHKVVLCEKSDKLGGVFNAAAAPVFKEADKTLIKWYEHNIKDNKAIELRMNTVVDNRLIDAIKPDCVIVATGAVPKSLPVKGSTGKNVVEVTDYLLGNKKIGEIVTVVGGGLSGCEAAYDMAIKGKHVTIIEMADEILNVKYLSAANSTMLKDLLKFNNVNVITSAMLKEITDHSVKVIKNEKEETIQCDSVVMATGYNAAPLQIESEADMYTIGDAVKAGNLLNAIWGAYDVALNI